MNVRADLVKALHFGVGAIHERPAIGTGQLAARRLILKDPFHVAGERRMRAVTARSSHRPPRRGRPCSG